MSAAREAQPDSAKAAEPGLRLPRAPEREPLVLLSSRDPRAARVERRLRGILSRWIAAASERTGGAANQRSVTVAVHVRALEDGVELAAVEADRALRPASNLKLVTTAAALVLIGPGMEFVTPFEARGELKGGVLQGDLLVRASGDPLCREDRDARIEPRLDGVAQDLWEQGLREVRGDLVLDEGTFADPAPGPGWPDPSQHWTEYCALSGGFSVNGGVLTAYVQPGRPGEAASVSVHPAPHGLAERYGVETTRDTFDVRVGATASSVTVQGKIPRWKTDLAAEFAHPDPVQHFGAVLADRLRARGIVIRGTTRRERGLPPGKTLAQLRSPVDETLGPINADSRNGVADQLFLAIGNAVTGDGSRAGGRAATARALERLGVASEGLVQVDGSGLSRGNRITPRQITALIGTVLAWRGVGERFRGSLAVAGRRGTMEDRLDGTPAEGRAFVKTGWIAGVSALSGICRTQEGEELVFSILVEYPRHLGGLNTHCFKPMQDEIVLALVEQDFER